MASKYGVYRVCRSSNGNIFKKKHSIDVYEANATKESMFIDSFVAKIAPQTELSRAFSSPEPVVSWSRGRETRGSWVLTI